jgi:pimeloyl-ACP methyl ester carboxylesterase
MNGYILLHGKKSGPAFADCALHPLVNQLRQHSLVDFESHAWSYDRLYDESFESSIASIKSARQRLVEQGATHIHLVGHSLGGNAAIYYATQHQDFASVILLAPAHNTHIVKIRAQCAWSVRKARALLETGNDGLHHFVDFDAVDVTVSTVRPSIYISYFDADGPCNMTFNAKKILEPINVLCLSGKADVTQTSTRELIYDQLPKTNQSQFHWLNEDHSTVCHNAHDIVVNWTKTLT